MEMSHYKRARSRDRRRFAPTLAMSNAAAMKNENRARNLAILSQLLNGSVSV